MAERSAGRQASRKAVESPRAKVMLRTVQECNSDHVGNNRGIDAALAYAAGRILRPRIFGSTGRSGVPQAAAQVSAGSFSSCQQAKHSYTSR
jgi:hypothetical protein